MDIDLCVKCCCSVPECPRPKNGREFCWTHGRVSATTSWEWQITRATRGFLDALVPCDLVVFLTRFQECQEDLVKILMLALIKEPSPIEAWAETGALDPSTRWTVDRSVEFHQSLTSMAQYVHQTPPTMEWKQLSTQGVCRYMGSLKTIYMFRIARKPGGSKKQQQLTKKQEKEVTEGYALPLRRT